MLDTRFWSKVRKQDDGCWIWTACINPLGYGMFAVGNRVARLAHRLAFMDAKGDIPPGTELDHVCRARACVNPAHLEAVTHAENVRRGKVGASWRERTHCKNGHAFTAENTGTLREHGKVVGRLCRACKRERRRKGRLADGGNAQSARAHPADHESAGAAVHR